MLNVVNMSFVSNLNLASNFVGIKINILGPNSDFHCPLHRGVTIRLNLPMRVADTRDHLPLAPI